MTDATTERWTIGEIVVTKVVETMLRHERAVDVLPITPADLDRHRSWMGPYLGPDGEMLMSVHTFCVLAGGRRVVVDTCIGNDRDYGDSPYLSIFNGLQTDLLERMAAGGFGRDDVDLVVCTHLHPDHVGWNTIVSEGQWEPTFRTARYVLSRPDVDLWRTMEGPHNPWPVSIGPLEEADVLDVVDAPCDLGAGLALIPTPGHTPGHVSVLLESAGEVGVITGDMVHSPVQLVEPSWTYCHDVDAGRAEASVRSLADMVVQRSALVLGTHFPEPTVGRLRRADDGDHWEP